MTSGENRRVANLYARIAANGGRFHIIDVSSGDHYDWWTLCGQAVPPDAHVTDGEYLDFDSPHISLCPKCKRLAVDA